MIDKLRKALLAAGNLCHRMCLIFLGYLTGTFTFALALMSFRAVRDGLEAFEMTAFVFLTFIVCFVLAYLLFKPVSLIILVGEALGLKSIIYYSAAWGLLALTVATNVTTWPQLGDDWITRHDHAIWFLSAAVGGAAYWVVAGRLTKVR